MNSLFLVAKLQQQSGKQGRQKWTLASDSYTLHPETWTLSLQVRDGFIVTFGGDDFLEVDDVLVLELLQDLDLADGRDRELRSLPAKGRRERGREGKERTGREGKCWESCGEVRAHVQRSNRGH